MWFVHPNNVWQFQHWTFSSQVLRHLAKVLHDADADADGAAMGPLGFRAVAVPQLAVTQLGLAETGPRFPVPVTSAAKVLESQQLQWEELYRKKFPHRRLQWTSLGAVQLLWRHRKGETLLIATERQGHVQWMKVELPNVKRKRTLVVPNFDFL